MEPKVQGRRADRLSLKPVRASFQADTLEKYSLGFQNLLASLIWVDLIQSHSEQRLENDEVSWEYQQVHSLTTLDPKFISAYRFGAIYLSVLRRDNLGAKLLLEKWHRQQPARWNPLYLLGYHLYYEMGLYKEASEKILRAAALPGAPNWLASLGVRLLSESGAAMQALRLSVQLFDEVRDPEARDRLHRRIRSLNYFIQKSSWTEALVAFRDKRQREPDSVGDLMPYYQAHVRAISSVPSQGVFSPELAESITERFHFRYDRRGRTMISIKTMEELGIEPLGTFKTQNAKEKAKNES